MTSTIPTSTDSDRGTVEEYTASETYSPTTQELIPIFKQYFQRELLLATLDPARFSKLQVNHNVKPIEPPWRRSPSTCDLAAAGDTSYWKPPSYLLAPAPLTRANCPSRYKSWSYKQTAYAATDEKKLDSDSDVATETSAASASSQGSGNVPEADTLLTDVSSDKHQRIVPVLPLTASQLRQKLLQVADPALKYSTVRRHLSLQSSFDDGFDLATGREDCDILNDLPVSNNQARHHSRNLAGFEKSTKLQLPEWTTEIHLTNWPPAAGLRGQNSKKPKCFPLTDLGLTSSTLDENKAFNKLWWDVPAEETIIRRAIQGRCVVADENSPQVLFPALSITKPQSRPNDTERELLRTTSPLNCVPLATKRRPPIEGFILATYNAEEIRISLAKLTRKLRTAILLLVIGIQHWHKGLPNNPRLREGRHPKPNTRGNQSNDFLKLTAAEKKAFYSSTQMNRIAIASSSLMDLDSSTEASSVMNGDGSKWTLVTRPEGLERWCVAEYAKTQSYARSVKLVLWRPCDIAIDDTLELAIGNDTLLDHEAIYRLEREITVINTRANTIEQLCAAWRVALLKLPRKVREVQVKATVPFWLDWQELEINLARMKSYALFRTGGTVNWVQSLEPERQSGLGLGSTMYEAAEPHGQDFAMDTEF